MIKPIFFPIFIGILLGMIFPITIYGESVAELEKKGIELLSQKRYEEAISYFDKILEIEPTNINALNNKGASLLGLERYENALDYFDKVLEIKPDDYTALSNTVASLSKAELVPIDETRFIVRVQNQLRNSEGTLIGVINGKASFYLQHEILDIHLDSKPVKEIVTIDGKKYEKMEVAVPKVVTDSDYGFNNFLEVTAGGNSAKIFLGHSHAFLVEQSDTVSALWTILRLVD